MLMNPSHPPNLYPQERQMPLKKHQSNSATTGRIFKVPRATLRLQTKLKRAHCQEKELTDIKVKEINWLIGRN